MKYSYLIMAVGLVISFVAEYYSIIGLTSIFAGAFWPVVIMGVTLGIGKITATLWLKANWERAPLTYKLYLMPAIAVLMFLTSIGCFGFLSQAHSEQGLVSGDATAKVAVYDERIATSRGNIEANRKALKQMDEAVDQVMARSTTETGADRAVTIRRSQAKERARLQTEIAAEQATIARLNEERAPLAAEVRKVEAETGPLKYIAAMIYGDNPDANLLESAVRWVIILIVAVFDPLALVLLLAAQQSWRWERQREEEEQLTPDPYVADVGEKPTKDELPMEDDEQAIEDWLERGRLVARDLDRQEEQNRINAANALLAEVEREVPEVIIPEPEVDLVAEANAKIAEIEREVPEFVPPEVAVVEQSDPTIECHKCNTVLIHAPGIGLFCPNKACDVMDGPFNDEEPVVLVDVPPAPIAEAPVQVPEPVEEVRVSSDEITVDSVMTASAVEPPVKVEPEIVTENVTQEKVMYSLSQGHITFEGKRMSVENLRSIRPDLILPPDGSIPNKIEYGSEFPKLSLAGDTYIRIDSIPHRVYKFNGKKWMPVDKMENTTYLTNMSYLRYLIEKLELSEYDPELLTYTEQDEIEEYLTNKKK